jgi:hypothetical protein
MPCRRARAPKEDGCSPKSCCVGDLEPYAMVIAPMFVRCALVVCFFCLGASCVLDRGGLSAGAPPSTATSSSAASGQGAAAASSSAASGAGGSGGVGGLGGAGGEGGLCATACVDLAGGEAVLRTKSSCPKGWNSMASQFVAADPGCQPCSCGTPQGGSCGVSNITTHGGKACGNGNTVAIALLAAGDCIKLTNGPDSYTTGPSVPSAGSCEASVSQPFAVQELDVCKPAQPLASCGSGRVCQPDLEQEICVLLPADVACPVSLPVATLLAESFSDSRQCACACGPANGLTCGKTGIDVFDSDDCSGAAAGSVAANTQKCTPIEGEGDQSIQVLQTTWSGSPCTALSQHSGTVAFVGKQRLCCPE